jgi:hypothetical protein
LRGTPPQATGEKNAEVVPVIKQHKQLHKYFTISPHKELASRFSMHVETEPCLHLLFYLLVAACIK